MAELIETHSEENVSVTHTDRVQQWILLYARVALGTAFLSAVAGRFGLWSHQPFKAHFAEFIQYTAEVNSFLPAAVAPVLAWIATTAEITLGVCLLAGFWRRWIAMASALLLALFGTAMAISFGIKSPMDYSVFSASAAAALIALVESQSEIATALRSK